MPSIAGCGIDCHACPVFIATEKNDDQLREKTAREWEKLFGQYIGQEHLSIGDMNCSGCRSEAVVFVGCSQCPIRACAASRSLDGCWACREFDQCEMINAFFQHNPSAKANIDQLVS